MNETQKLSVYFLRSVMSNSQVNSGHDHEIADGLESLLCLCRHNFRDGRSFDLDHDHDRHNVLLDCRDHNPRDSRALDHDALEQEDNRCAD